MCLFSPKGDKNSSQISKGEQVLEKSNSMQSADKVNGDLENMQKLKRKSPSDSNQDQSKDKLIGEQSSIIKHHSYNSKDKSGGEDQSAAAPPKLDKKGSRTTNSKSAMSQKS